MFKKIKLLCITTLSVVLYSTGISGYYLSPPSTVSSQSPILSINFPQRPHNTENSIDNIYHWIQYCNDLVLLFFPDIEQNKIYYKTADIPFTCKEWMAHKWLSTLNMINGSLSYFGGKHSAEDKRSKIKFIKEKYLSYAIEWTYNKIPALLDPDKIEKRILAQAGTQDDPVEKIHIEYIYFPRIAEELKRSAKKRDILHYIISECAYALTQIEFNVTKLEQSFGSLSDAEKELQTSE